MVQLFTIYVFWVIVCYIMGNNNINFLFNKDPYEEIMTQKQKNQEIIIGLIASFLWFLTIPFYIVMRFLEWRDNMRLKKTNYIWYCIRFHNQYINRFEVRYGREIFNYKNKTNSDGF
jgi:hypothetical protein